MPEIVVDDTTTEKDTPLRRQIREENTASLVDYLKNLATETPIKVTVIRELPKSWGGRNIEGTLDSFEEPISEEEIRDMFGGGKYKLIIYTPGPTGNWQYATSRKIKIAGDPNIDGLVKTGGNNGSDESPSVVRDAMNLAAAAAQRAERRAEQERERAMHQMPQGPDPALQMAMDEMRALRAENAEATRRMLALATQKPDTSSMEMLLGKTLDGESTRIQAIQMRVDSELRMRADMHKAEIDRLHQRYEDIARRQEDSHKREIDNFRQSMELQIATLKMSYEGQLAGLKREISSLDRELTSAKVEVSELRAKKDKSPVETLTELAAMKEAMESFTGSGEKEEGSTWERIIGGVMGSPLAEGIAARVAGGPSAVGAAMPQQQQPQEDAEIPFNRPVELPDGRVIVRKTDGTIVQIKRKAPAPTNADGSVMVAIPDGDLQIAVSFLENAFANDADPKEFARTAKSLAPALSSGPIPELLRKQGVDALLDRVAKLHPHSTLLSQAGKNWVRKVATALIE